MQKWTNVKVMAILIALAVMALTSCGGGSTTGLGLDNSSSTGGSLSSADQSGTTATSGGVDDPASHDATDDKGKHLPGLPVDDKGGSRSASAVESFPGSSAIEFANAQVVDTTMVLSSTEADMAWALYKVEGLQGRKVTGVSIELLNSPTSQYSVGVSNFSDGVWDFLATSSLPEFEYDLSDDMSRMTSEVGNLYFVVVVSGGASTTVVGSSVFSRELQPGEQERPAFGKGISASEGQPSSITITWTGIDGAGSYELWREADIEGQDEASELISTIPAVDGQLEYSYEDTAIQLGVEYKYRVRGVNAEGQGEFSRAASGWAGDTPPAGDDNGIGGNDDPAGDDNGGGTEAGDDNGAGNDDPAGDDNGIGGNDDPAGDDNGTGGDDTTGGGGGDDTGGDTGGGNGGNGGGDDPIV